MHSINLTPEEYKALVEEFGYALVNEAVANVVSYERNEDWKLLNDGITDENMVRSSCGLRRSTIEATA